MSQHSALVGGSTADRILNCPGSYRAIISMPPQPEVRSEAADLGTHCHHVMDALMQARMADDSTNLYEDAEVWLGDVFFDRELTQDTLDILIYPALDALAKLEIENGRGFKVAAIEVAAGFPGIVGAGGTADLLLASFSHVVLVDWKFGAVPVRAYTVFANDDEASTMNPQLMFYLCAVRHAKPKLFRNRKITAAIVQPRDPTPLSYTEVFPEELLQFEEDIHKAVNRALGRDPPLNRGEWCRWCPAKPACPEWLKPLIDLAGQRPLFEGLNYADKEVPVSRMPTPYGEMLARAKELSELVGEFAKEVDRQLEHYLAQGGIVPGWALERKKKQRKWVDPAVVVPELIKLGFRDDEIWRHELQTFQVTDAAAKKRGRQIPEHLRVAPDTDEMKIVRSTAHKSLVDSSDLLNQLKASVALIDRGKTNTKGS